MAKRTILFIGGGIETVPVVRLARTMGLHTVVSDMNPTAPACAVAHDSLVASTYDIEQTLRQARQYHEQRPLDGVICVATDVPMTVAAVAAELGLPGIPLAAAALAMDKLAMKQKFAADDIAIPWFMPVANSDQLKDITSDKQRSFVLKPVDSRGARGVLRLDAVTDLDWAYRHAAENSPSGRVMIEEFLSGPQLSTESLVVDGVCCTPGISDRNYEYLDRYAPHIIENGGDLPSCLAAETISKVKRLVEQAAASMGITRGVVKGDIVIHNNQPKVIELAARLSGGYFCSHEIPLNTGVDLVGCAIRQCLGETIAREELLPRFQHHVCQRYLFPAPGRVVAVNGIEQAAQMPGVELCEVRVQAGDVIRSVDSHPARAGVIICTGNSRKDALERTLAAVAAISIETQVR